MKCPSVSVVLKFKLGVMGSVYTAVWLLAQLLAREVENDAMIFFFENY